MVTPEKPWSLPQVDLIKSVNMYENPAPIPTITWEDYPKDLQFEDLQHKMEAYGIAHTAAHGELLFELAKTGKGEGFIVELGTYWGTGACYLAAGSKTVGRERVITIDIDRGHIFSLYSTQFYDRPPMQIFRSHMNFLMMGVCDWVIPMRCSSLEAAEILDIQVRVLHIDAGHVHPDPSWDVLVWLPKLISGASVVFHDCETEGVMYAIKKFVHGSKWCAHFEQIDNMTAFAIAK